MIRHSLRPLVWSALLAFLPATARAADDGGKPMGKDSPSSPPRADGAPASKTSPLSPPPARAADDGGRPTGKDGPSSPPRADGAPASKTAPLSPPPAPAADDGGKPAGKDSASSTPGVDGVPASETPPVSPAPADDDGGKPTEDDNASATSGSDGAPASETQPLTPAPPPAAAAATDDGWQQVEDSTSSTPGTDGAPASETHKKVLRKPGRGIKDGAWALMIGPQVGWATERQIEQEQGNADKNGYFFAGKVFATRFADRFIFDVGAGWQYTALDGDENVEENGVYAKKLATVESQAFSLDLGADVRLGRFWSAGVALSQLWGDDLSFGSRKGNVTSATTGGINIAYTDLRDDGLFRYRLQALTDINIPKRHVYWVALGVELGIPLTGYDHERRIEELSQTSRRTEETVVEKPVPVAQNVRVISTPLDPSLVSFEDPSGKLRPKAEPFLRDLCAMVQRTKDSFEYVEMQYVMPSEGLGRGDQNQASQRATTLAQRCQSLGVPANKVRGEGLLVQPMPGEHVMPYVNVRFYRIADEDVLKRDIVDLQKRYRQPETCRNGKCR